MTNNRSWTLNGLNSELELEWHSIIEFQRPNKPEHLRPFAITDRNCRLEQFENSSRSFVSPKLLVKSISFGCLSFFRKNYQPSRRNRRIVSAVQILNALQPSWPFDRLSECSEPMFALKVLRISRLVVWFACRCKMQDSKDEQNWMKDPLGECLSKFKFESD